MATYYVDLYNGDDTNSGTTITTPKKTIQAASDMVTAYDDVIKVRSDDNAYRTSVGNWTWTNGSGYITASGDWTGTIFKYDWVCKASDTYPQLFFVSTITYSSTTDLTTIKIYYSTTQNQQYFGETETTETILAKPSVLTDGQSMSEGYYSGSIVAASGRTYVEISGGWNSDYTVQNGFTIMYGKETTNNPYNAPDAFSVSSYYNFSKFLIINHHWVFIPAVEEYVNIGIKDCVFAGNYGVSWYIQNTNDSAFYYGLEKLYAENINVSCQVPKTCFSYIQYSVIENSVFEYNYRLGYPCYELKINNSTFNNHSGEIFRGSSDFRRIDGNGYNELTNSVLNNKGLSSKLFSTDCDNSIVRGNSGDVTFLSYVTNNVSIIDNDFNMIITPSDSRQSVYNASGKFINNVKSGTLGITGNNYTRVTFGEGSIISEPLLPSSGFTINIDVSNIFGDIFYTQDSVFDAMRKAYVNLKDNNYIFHNTGWVGLSDIITHSGTNSLRFESSDHITQCYLSSINFQFDAANTYGLSFYARSGSFLGMNMSYNIMLNNEWLWETWEEITMTDTFTQFNKTGITIPTSGKGELYFSFSGINAYVDDIEITY